MVGKGQIFRHLGAPLGCYTSTKQAFEWVHKRIHKKMSRWRNVILPFHSRIKVINAILIPYITFFSPFLCMSQRNWKTLLQSICNFLWRNKLGKGNPWHWGKWEGVATPKEMGGLDIINPIHHAIALCAKLFVLLASSNQIWMGREVIVQSKLWFIGG